MESEPANPSGRNSAAETTTTNERRDDKTQAHEMTTTRAVGDYEALRSELKKLTVKTSSEMKDEKKMTKKKQNVYTLPMNPRGTNSTSPPLPRFHVRPLCQNPPRTHAPPPPPPHNLEGVPIGGMNGSVPPPMWHPNMTAARLQQDADDCYSWWRGVPIMLPPYADNLNDCKFIGPLFKS